MESDRTHVERHYEALRLLSSGMVQAGCECLGEYESPCDGWERSETLAYRAACCGDVDAAIAILEGSLFDGTVARLG